MSRLPLDRRGPSLALGVDRERIVLGGASAASWALRESPPNALRDAGGALRGGWIDVIAGNDLALHWLQSPPASVASMTELHLVAQARCTHLYGTPPGGWRIAADWRIDRPFVCAALAQDVVALVEDQVTASGMSARWHTAWSLLTCAMGSSFPSDGWSAVRTPARVMLWHCTRGEVDSLTGWPSSPEEDSQAAQLRARQHVQLEGSRSEHPGAGALHWVDMAGSDASGPGSEASLALKLHALAAGATR